MKIHKKKNKKPGYFIIIKQKINEKSFDQIYKLKIPDIENKETKLEYQDWVSKLHYKSSNHRKESIASVATVAFDKETDNINIINDKNISQTSNKSTIQSIKEDKELSTPLLNNDNKEEIKSNDNVTQSPKKSPKKDEKKAILYDFDNIQKNLINNITIFLNFFSQIFTHCFFARRFINISVSPQMDTNDILSFGVFWLLLIVICYLVFELKW